MADSFTTQRLWSAQSLGSMAVKYTPADTDLPRNVKAVVFDAAGTISYKNADDISATAGFPVTAGQPIPFIPARITTMTGATTCWLIF